MYNHCQQIENLEEMGTFIEKQRLSTLTQEGLNIKLRKKHTQNKSQTQTASLAKYTKCLKKKILKNRKGGNTFQHILLG